MEVSLTQRQITGRVLLSHILRLVRIIVANRHIGMEDREPSRSCLLCASHGGFSHTRTWTIGSEDHGSRGKSPVREGSDDAVTAFVESYVDKGFTVLYGVM